MSEGTEEVTLCDLPSLPLAAAPAAVAERPKRVTPRSALAQLPLAHTKSAVGAFQNLIFLFAVTLVFFMSSAWGRSLDWGREG